MVVKTAHGGFDTVQAGGNVWGVCMLFVMEDQLSLGRHAAHDQQPAIRSARDPCQRYAIRPAYGDQPSILAEVQL